MVCCISTLLYFIKSYIKSGFLQIRTMLVGEVAVDDINKKKQIKIKRRSSRYAAGTIRMNTSPEVLTIP